MKFSKADGLKSGEKMRKDIFFNKKRREELRKTFLRTQKAILQYSDFSIKPFSEQEYAQRRLETSTLALTVKSLEMIKEAEEFDKKTYLTNCKFYLFKKGKAAIIKATFLKPLLDNNLKTTFVYFSQGLPKNVKKKAIIYKEKFEFEGYKLMDSGTFKQKILNFEEWTIKLKSKEIDFKIRLKIINSDKQSYWTNKSL